MAAIRPSCLFKLRPPYTRRWDTLPQHLYDALVAMGFSPRQSDGELLVLTCFTKQDPPDDPDTLSEPILRFSYLFYDMESEVEPDAVLIPGECFRDLLSSSVERLPQPVPEQDVLATLEELWELVRSVPGGRPSMALTPGECFRDLLSSSVERPPQPVPEQDVLATLEELWELVRSVQMAAPKHVIVMELLTQLIEDKVFTAKEIEKALGRIQWATAVCPLTKSLMQPFWAWKMAVTSSGRPPKFVRLLALLLQHLFTRPYKQLSPYLPKSTWWGCSDASASSEGQAFIGGWLSSQPDPGKDTVWWFHMEITPQEFPWAFKEGDPKKRIAALELFATLILCHSMLDHQGHTTSHVRLPVGSDNQGNVFALLNMASKKPHTAILLMELILTLHTSGSSLAPSHVPRELNQWADELTHTDFVGFNSSLRIDVKAYLAKLLLVPRLRPDGQVDFTDSSTQNPGTGKVESLAKQLDETVTKVQALGHRVDKLEERQEQAESYRFLRVENSVYLSDLWTQMENGAIPRKELRQRAAEGLAQEVKTVLRTEVDEDGLQGQKFRKALLKLGVESRLPEGFCVKAMPADGNCLFHSFSEAMFRVSNVVIPHGEIRARSER
eukprot:Skav208930  [mRNA]  locus=scaffold787:204648:215139:- [translate_table: standard]